MVISDVLSLDVGGSPSGLCGSGQHRWRLPRPHLWWCVVGVALVCLLPAILNLAGADFSSPGRPLDIEATSHMSPGQIVDAIHHTLEGSFNHTILEWSAFCTAMFTVILAFVHFKVKRDIVTPIIAVSLFWAGCMDAFHTLAADRLIDATAANENLIPFTWAICRTFNALIPIICVGVLLLRGSAKSGQSRFWFVSMVSLFFGFLAYGIIHFCATSGQLPRTMFPGSLVTRPWDVAPLVLYLFAGVVVYPAFFRRFRGSFVLAMWLSVLPNLATQFHMAFGSTALFDNHFNIAHFLKIIAYFVPFFGLAADYVRAYREEKAISVRLGDGVVRREDSIPGRGSAQALHSPAWRTARVARR